MLRFFRRLRQKLLSQNRLGKYTLYALGEILLVVVGILIALQVDTWNQRRLDRKDEANVARDIYIELQENKRYLENTLQQWNRRSNCIKALSEVLAAEKPWLGKREFDSLLVGTLTFNIFSPHRNRMDRVLSSENFEFSESDKLLKEMMTIASLYDDLDEYFQYNLDTWKQIVQPYLIEHYSFRNLNFFLSSGAPGAWEDSGIPHEPLLADPVFDNIVNNMDGDLQPILRLLKRSLLQIEGLLQILESSYPQIKTNPDRVIAGVPSFSGRRENE